MIEVNNLVRKYGDTVAVDGLSFCLEPGKVYGFLGPNGAGKSTTMNIMTGYLGATEGEVIINGHNILEEPEEAKKCIGYLPEIPPLYMDMTVEEYLQFAASLKRLDKKKIPEYIEEAKKLTKVKEVENRLIKNLSKGYRQRVGLAYAVLGFPEIIILDEPTVGLDPVQIIEIRELIKKLSENHTVIFSSHILSEVSEICDYVLIISHGRLVASDSIDHLYQYQGETGELRLTVKANEESVTDVLKDLKGVSGITGTQNGSFTELSVIYDETDEVLERIFYTLADAKMPVYEMQKNKKSLEELFIELTGDGEEEKETENDDFFDEDESDEEIQENLEKEEENTDVRDL